MLTLLLIAQLSAATELLPVVENGSSEPSPELAAPKREAPASQQTQAPGLVTSAGSAFLVGLLAISAVTVSLHVGLLTPLALPVLAGVAAALALVWGLPLLTARQVSLKAALVSVLLTKPVALCAPLLIPPLAVAAVYLGVVVWLLSSPVSIGLPVSAFRASPLLLLTLALAYTFYHLVAAAFFGAVPTALAAILAALAGSAVLDAIVLSLLVFLRSEPAP